MGKPKKENVLVESGRTSFNGVVANAPRKKHSTTRDAAAIRADIAEITAETKRAAEEATTQIQKELNAETRKATEAVGDAARRRDAAVALLRVARAKRESAAANARNAAVAAAHGAYQKALAVLGEEFDAARSALDVTQKEECAPFSEAYEEAKAALHAKRTAVLADLAAVRDEELAPLREELAAASTAELPAPAVDAQP